MADEFYLYFDESGNLGTSGRYFVIACIMTENPKELNNVMKKTLLQIKKNYPRTKQDGYEIKAKDANPTIKSEVIRKIVSKNISISYIVADKTHTGADLIKDNNCIYNYLLKILLDNFKNTFRNNKVNLILDNKTVKIKSQNSFQEYIKIHFNYELKLKSEITVEYRDSKAWNSFNVQAVDYIANALYAYHEYGNDRYMNLIDTKKLYVEKFPRRKFGTPISEADEEVATSKII